MNKASVKDFIERALLQKASTRAWSLSLVSAVILVMFGITFYMNVLINDKLGILTNFIDGKLDQIDKNKTKNEELMQKISEITSKADSLQRKLDTILNNDNTSKRDR